MRYSQTLFSCFLYEFVCKTIERLETEIKKNSDSSYLASHCFLFKFHLHLQIIRHPLQVGGWVNILHLDIVRDIEADGSVV